MFRLSILTISFLIVLSLSFNAISQDIEKNWSSFDSIKIRYKEAVNLFFNGKHRESTNKLNYLFANIPVHLKNDSTVFGYKTNYALMLARVGYKSKSDSLFNELISQYKNDEIQLSPDLGVFLYTNSARANKSTPTHYMDFANKALAIISNNNITPEIEAKLYYSMIFDHFHRRGRMKECLDYTKKIVELSSQNKFDDEQFQLMTYELPTSIYNDKSTLNKRIQAFNKAIQFGKTCQVNDRVKTTMARLCHNAGSMAWSQNATETALDYYREGLNWVDSEKEIYRYYRYIILSGIHACEARNGNINIAIKESNDLLKVMDFDQSINKTAFVKVYHDRNSIFKYARLNSELIENLDNFLQMIDEGYGPNIHHPQRLRDLLSAAQFYAIAGDFENSLRIFESDNFDPTLKLEDPYAIDYILSLIAHKRYDEAHQAFDKMKHRLNNQSSDNTPHDRLQLISYIFEIARMIKSQSNASDIDQLLTTTLEKNYLETVKEAASHTWELKPNTPHILKEINNSIFKYDDAHDILSDQWVYILFDNFRNIELLQEQESNRFWNNSGIADSIIDKRFDLIQQIIDIKAANQKYNKGYAGVQITDSLIQAQDALKLMEQQNGIHQFKNRKFLPAKESLQQLKEVMNSDEVCLSYLWEDNDLRILSIGHDTTFTYKQSIDTVQRLVANFINYIKHPFSDELLEIGLYDVLIKPVLQHYSKISKLYIIPDGLLHSIPFESLTDEHGTHLVENYSISYELSSQNLINNIAASPILNANLISYAPQFRKDSLETDVLITMLMRDDNYHLPCAQIEAKQIAKIWNGKSLLGDKANKSQFIKSKNKADIIHLSLHALFDEYNHYNSRLKFGDAEEDELRFGEIANQYLDAELVTLSACNTGVSHTDTKRNSKSLARGFLSAGAKSVVMSLWRVPDKSTSKIMIAFYEHLKTGVTKDVALQQAKLDYLAQVEDPKQAHPYYWAGFVVFGDTSPLSPPGCVPWKWICGALILIGLGWGYVRSRGKKVA